jgi:hypothetical protein
MYIHVSSLTKSALVILVFGLLTLGQIASVKASTITWTLENVTPFASGQTATGFFTVEQQLRNTTEDIDLAPVVDWNIMLTGGSNPGLTNLDFSTTNTGCVAFCVRLDRGSSPSLTNIQFRTPLAPDNTIYEFNLGISGSPSEVIFPSISELALRSGGVMTGTFVDKALFIPPNTLAFIDGDNLLASANANIVTASVPEPGSLICFVSALSLGLGAVVVRSLRRRAAA